MVCGVEWPRQDPKTYVLWKWQRDSSPNKIFLFIRISFLVYFFATTVICALNVNCTVEADLKDSDPLNLLESKNERLNSWDDEDINEYPRYNQPSYEHTAPLRTTSIGLFLGGKVTDLSLITNRFFIYGMIAGLTCSLVQHLWATITLLLFYLNNENYVSWARSYKIYVVTQKISHDFSFMLMVTHWAIYDSNIEIIRLVYGLDSAPTIMCFAIYYPMCVIEVLMIRHKIDITHFVISLVASLLLMLITLSVMLGLDEIADHIDRLQSMNKRNFSARLFDAPIIWFLGFHVYAFAIFMCVNSHFLLMMVQTLRDIIKYDDGDRDAPVTA